MVVSIRCIWLPQIELGAIFYSPVASATITCGIGRGYCLQPKPLF